MDQAAATVSMWVNDFFVWIGFGTVVGLIAKAIMPGRDPGGAIATLGTGIGGTIVGCGVYTFIVGGNRLTPLSAVGAIVATAGAFALLFFYRLLSGYFFQEGETNLYSHFRIMRRRAYRRREDAMQPDLLS